MNDLDRTATEAANTLPLVNKGNGGRGYLKSVHIGYIFDNGVMITQCDRGWRTDKGWTEEDQRHYCRLATAAEPTCQACITAVSA